MIMYIKNLKSDDSGRVSFELKENIGCIDSGGENISFSSPINVKGSIERNDNVFLIRGEVQTEVILQCSRCLRTVKYPLSTAFSQMYSETGEGEDVLPIRGDRIDLNVPVKESILLELPIKVLCSEDCKGLCPICGGDRNTTQCDCRHEGIDPRMEKLKKLLE